MKTSTELQDRLKYIARQTYDIRQNVLEDGLNERNRAIQELAWMVQSLAEIIEKHFATGEL